MSHAKEPEGRTGERLPERFGGYLVESLIGAGGMGIVYQAFDEALQRSVALKTLLPALAADPEFVARFKREAQSAASLNHPNITQIYTIGQEGTVPFFAMELILGSSLEGLLRKSGPLDPARATTFVLQAAQGLRHAAQKNLIHRDIKPSNLMLADDGTVKITDFGLAKAAQSSTQLTATGEVLGSPGYISPEQAQGQPLDARSDIYSLGASFYHLVTGKLPFEAPTPVAMIVKHLNEPLRSPRALNPAIPFPVAAVIQKMMAKRAGERFQDYDLLIKELERALAAARQPGAAPAGGIEARPRPRGTVPVAAGGGAAARPRAGSWIPILLASALGAMLIAGVVQQRRTSVTAPSPERAGVVPLSSAGADRPAASGAAGTLRPGIGPLADREDGALRERLRDRLRPRGTAKLTFNANDHQTLPDGRVKVFGEVTNSGVAAAAQARVRIRIMDESGTVVAQGEAPLFPSLVSPGGTARYELSMDYRGPIGTINAELSWVE